MGRLFEKQGNPLVSAREGREKFGRLLDIENVDYDAETQKLSTKFWDRKIAEELRNTPTIVAKPVIMIDSPETIAQRRARNIIRKYNQKYGRLE